MEKKNRKRNGKKKWKEKDQIEQNRKRTDKRKTKGKQRKKLTGLFQTSLDLSSISSKEVQKVSKNFKEINKA